MSGFLISMMSSALGHAIHAKPTKTEKQTTPEAPAALPPAAGDLAWSRERIADACKVRSVPQEDKTKAVRAVEKASGKKVSDFGATEWAALAGLLFGEGTK